MVYWLLLLGDSLPHGEFLRRGELRAVLAAVTAFAMVLISGRPFIRFLASHRVLEHSERGDSQRLDEMHASKSRTPTLGGVVFFGAVVVSTLLWARPGERLVLLILAYVMSLCVLGFLDDTKKLRTKKGLSARAKFRTQVVLSLLAGGYLYAYPIGVTHAVAGGSAGTCLFFPFFKDLYVQTGVGFIALVACVGAGSSNAVNLTDGLDGLAVGSSLLVAAAFTVVACVAGSAETSSLFRMPHVEGGLEVAVILGSLIGGGLGFLWFNCHPAQIFMGDTGALPLGGTLGLAAVVLKQELLLVLAGGVLVAEALSVILQVASYKLRKKRIFLIAPLHHHYQFKGWPETKITVRFWIVGAILALFSLVSIGA